MIAALYIDPRGPYPRCSGVDCWDEARDARDYEGPWPAVAHPPCGPWGALAHLYKGKEHGLGPRAVAQVRQWGGVLEHPARSRLWAAVSLPRPGESADSAGGFTIEVRQVDWGHACVKPTWLYIVGVAKAEVEALVAARPYPGRQPTHGIWYGDFERSGHAGPKLKGASKEIRRRTPPEFAKFLLALAGKVGPR